MHPIVKYLTITLFKFYDFEVILSYINGFTQFLSVKKGEKLTTEDLIVLLAKNECVICTIGLVEISLWDLGCEEGLICSHTFGIFF